MSATHQAILDALCRRAAYDPSTILARLPGPDGEPVTVARMAGALASGEPWAREWAEDVTGAAVRMVVGRGPSEPVDLDAWRAEASEAARAVASMTTTPLGTAARIGWPRDAARVGVLCAEVERLRAALAVAERAASMCAGEVAELRAECARLGVEAADAKWSLTP